MAILTFLHTNDLHHRLTLTTAERLRGLKANQSPALLLDAGDAVGCGNLDFRPWGERVHDLMNLAGYDGAALGNREFHPWVWPLRCTLKRARFPFLCANLRLRATNSPSPQFPPEVRPFVLFTRPEGLTVAVFGLVVEMVRPGTWGARLSQLVCADAVETARQLVPTLRAQAEVVVCLSHLGQRRERELAAAVEGIDLIIGSHSHTPLPEPERVKGTLIAQAKPYAQAVGRVTVEVGNEGLRLLRGELMPL